MVLRNKIISPHFAADESSQPLYKPYRRATASPALSMNLGKQTMAGLSKRALSARAPIVDIHTHVYLPRYAEELRARSSAPRIYSRMSADDQPEERLLILDGEPGVGRPVGPQVGLPRSDLCSTILIDLRCSESTGTETKNCCL